MAIKHIYTGTASPNSAPVALGHHFVDTASGNHFVSKGSATAADWVLQGNFRSASLELDNITPVTVPHVFNKAKEELQVLLFSSAGELQSADSYVVGGTSNASITILLNSGNLSGAYCLVLPWKATGVQTSGDQTIGGTKTFSTFPVTPSSAPSSDYQVANKKYFDDNAVNNTGAQTIGGAKTFSTGMVVNENGDAVDTRMEGATDINLLFLDASADKIGIGTSTPSEKLEVNGNIKASGVKLPGTTPASGTLNDMRSTMKTTGNVTGPASAGTYVDITSSVTVPAGYYEAKYYVTLQGKAAIPDVVLTACIRDGSNNIVANSQTSALVQNADSAVLFCFVPVTVAVETTFKLSATANVSFSTAAIWNESLTGVYSDENRARLSFKLEG